MDTQHTPSPVTMDSRTLRRAFGTFATGVTVLTVGGVTPHGMTANSFTAVSLDPPLVLVCVDREAVMHACLTRADDFAISVLAAEQEQVARYFADRSRPMGGAQFDAVDWAPGRLTGAPLIEGAMAHFECRISRTYDGGDHTIFLGQLLSLDQPSDGEALLFLSGRFRRAERERSDVS